MPTEFKIIENFCLCCGNKLKLNNSRDIERKNFCSRKCNSSYLLKIRWKDDNYAKKMIETSSKPNPKKASRKFTTPMTTCCNCAKDYVVIRYSENDLNNNINDVINFFV